MKRVIALTLLCLFAAGTITVAIAADDGVNLLLHGGLEKDTDGDGVPDGWLGHAHHFSRVTLDEVRAYVGDLPPHEQLLKGEKILWQ